MGRPNQKETKEQRGCSKVPLRGTRDGLPRGKWELPAWKYPLCSLEQHLSKEKGNRQQPSADKLEDGMSDA